MTKTFQYIKVDDTSIFINLSMLWYTVVSLAEATYTTNLNYTNMIIRESLVDAFKRNWDMYQDAVNNIPDEHWRTGDIEYLIPARLVNHVLDCVDFYSNPKPNGTVSGHRFKIDLEKATSEQLPSKEQTKTYLTEMIEKLDGWLQGFSNAELLSGEKAFPWTGKTVLGRAIYLLVHCRQHIGEINAELRRRGLPRIKWR